MFLARMPQTFCSAQIQQKLLEEKNVDKDKKEETVVITEEPLVLTNEIVDKEEKSSNKTLSPAVRKIVEENNINLNSVQGSGKDGRILKSDQERKVIKLHIVPCDRVRKQIR